MFTNSGSESKDAIASIASIIAFLLSEPEFVNTIKEPRKVFSRNPAQ
jgi:hypothetical protein